MTKEREKMFYNITSMILDNLKIDEIKQVDLPVNYKFENTIEFLLKIYSNLNTFEINEDKVIYKTTIQCLMRKKKYKGFDPDELLDSIQNKIKLEGFSSDKINQWITFSRNIINQIEVDFVKLNFKEGSLGRRSALLNIYLPNLNDLEFFSLKT